MTGLCLAVAGAAASLMLPIDGFTLSWTHSVEKVEWQETWRIAAGRLELVAARVRGSGAGMEPPDDARWEAGWWVYRPDLAPLERLVLAHSSFTADYTLCAGGTCWPLSALVPGEAPVELHACP